MASSRATVTIEVTGANKLRRALKVLGERDAPYLREALTDAGELLASETRRRAPGGIARTVDFTRVTGKGATQRATVVVRHPGAKAMEFGRSTYYRGFTGRRMKLTGTPFRSRGQRARPYAGVIKGDQAIGAVAARAREAIETAIEREWERIAVRGSD